MTSAEGKNEFKIKFDGQLHQVDANTLINSLINISTILQESNTEINPDEKIEVKIKALSQGSFLVHLAIFAEKAFQSAIVSNALGDGADFVTILAGLFGLKKHLLGKKPKSVESEGDKVKVINERGNVFVIESLTYGLYERNQPIQDAITGNFETLRNDSSVEGFEITDKTEKVLFSAARDSFEEMAIKSIAGDESKRTITETATLHIFKIVFQDNYKWEFYYKGNRISANIIDENFFKRVDQGESFAKGDTLIVDLQINQIFEASVNTWVNHSYQVVSVVKHIPRGKQQELSFDQTSEPDEELS